MIFGQVNRRGLGLLGCGKMGSALLEGWLRQGLALSAVWVAEPQPSDWLRALAAKGLHLNEGFPAGLAIVLVAVKPQMMAAALPVLGPLGGGGTLFVSIAAGTPISFYEGVLGAETPIVRAMPNTPAAVGRGITALTGNAASSEEDMALAEAFLAAVGQTVRLEGEHQMDAVTAVSGSGPAYVFHLIEALAAAGEAEGLPPDMAMQLARATVSGAGELAHRDSLGNVKGIPPGDVQRMSAGTGVQHSEFNHAVGQQTHFLHIWLLPNQQNVQPSYEQKTVPTQHKQGALVLIASEQGQGDAVKIHADAKLYAGLFEQTQTASLTLDPTRKAYVHLIKGELKVNDISLSSGDALFVADETVLTLTDGLNAEVLIFDLAA
jgi:pyrroline-5-carboxylate reductase